MNTLTKLIKQEAQLAKKAGCVPSPPADPLDGYYSENREIKGRKRKKRYPDNTYRDERCW